jgi:Ca2+-binding EF-hand superfamily protein
MLMAMVKLISKVKLNFFISNTKKYKFNSNLKEFCTMMSRKGNSMDNEEGLMEAFQRFDKVSLIK